MKRLLICTLAFTVLAFAEGTKTWQQSSFDEFSRGTTKGIAIRSDGSLELAPSFKSLHTSPATYIWSIASDPAGNIYVGTGSPARVYRITPDGKATVIFQPKELQVQSIVLDAKGVLYAATSPDGMVYKIEKGEAGKVPAAKPADTKSKKDAHEVPGGTEPGAKEQNEKAPAAADKDKQEASKEADKTPVDPSYTSSVFFDPKTKYIWSLAFDNDGRLYIATGDRGEIFRVNKDGSNALFFKSDEAHIRSLMVQADGNIIAGSDGSGLIYRITPAGDGFVLFSASKKEITALAADSAGNIYAAGVGEKRTGTTTSVSPIIPQIQIGPSPAPTAGPQAPTPQFFPSFNSSGGSEVYMISPDGSPKRLWNSRDDIIYALTFDANGRLLAGSGNKGRLVAIAKNGDYVDLLKASANQITGFAPAPGGALYLATSNLGKVFSLGAASTEEGVFESEVFDARIFSKWGRVEVDGTGNFEIYGRSGNVDNPDRNWSPWKKVSLESDSEFEAPPARFMQWKMVVPARSAARVKSVKLNYRPKNVAPVIDDIAVQTGARFNSSGSSISSRSTSETIMVGVGNQPPTPSLSLQG
ncbi:MAG TPA: two-component regulator propeller domain-containing protein, partial [Terriglobales bacterium]|nr:two-component regulator propeller domain-containing protein [Terriglobales bacterium]